MWGEGGPPASRGRGPPSPHTPQPLPGALYWGGWKDSGLWRLSCDDCPLDIWMKKGNGKSVSPLKNVKREAAAQRRPAQCERKTAFFPRNARPYGLKCGAFPDEGRRFFFSCCRETGGQGRDTGEQILAILPARVFAGGKGARGKGGGFLQEAWQLKKHFFEGASYLDLFKFFCDFKRLSRKT